MCCTLLACSSIYSLYLRVCVCVFDAEIRSRGFAFDKNQISFEFTSSALILFDLASIDGRIRGGRMCLWVTENKIYSKLDTHTEHGIKRVRSHEYMSIKVASRLFRKFGKFNIL